MSQQNIVTTLALGGYIAFAIYMRIKEWGKNKEARMITIYAPDELSMGKLKEFAEQNNCKLTRSFVNQYFIVPDQAKQREPATALGCSNVVPLHRQRKNATTTPKGAV